MTFKHEDWLLPTKENGKHCPYLTPRMAGSQLLSHGNLFLDVGQATSGPCASLPAPSASSSANRRLLSQGGYPFLEVLRR